jgi:hypothetical protein
MHGHDELPVKPFRYLTQPSVDFKQKLQINLPPSQDEPTRMDPKFTESVSIHARVRERHHRADARRCKSLLCFNPRPRARATPPGGPAHQQVHVSIHARLRARPHDIDSDNRFQSTRAYSSGRQLWTPLEQTGPFPNVNPRPLVRAPTDSMATRSNVSNSPKAKYPCCHADRWNIN